MIPILFLVTTAWTAPSAMAEECLEAGPAELCAGEVADGGCNPEPGGYECYERSGHGVRASAGTAGAHTGFGAGYAQWNESARFTAGECTVVTVEGRSEHVEVAGAAQAWPGAAQGGLWLSRGEGVLVYEDPCGEALIPDLEPGTYEYRFHFLHTHAIAGFGPAVAYVALWHFDEALYDENGDQAYCHHGTSGYVYVAASGLGGVGRGESLRHPC